MAILSSAVNPGDDALASQYNNLRIDLLIGDVTIAGVKTFSSKPICSAGITLNDDSNIAAAKKLHFGSATYIWEESPNNLNTYVGGAKRLVCSSSIYRVVTINFGIDTTKRFYYDGAGHTYNVESSDNVVDYVVGGSIKMRMDSNGIAPGDNESMMWDVVIINLDGTSPDDVGYIIDELKVYGIYTTSHVSATSVRSQPGETHGSFAYAEILSNTLTIVYASAAYGSGDPVQVLIFYIA